MQTYYLRSFGCQMNDHDAERIRALLESDGLRRVESVDDADVLVYNTCTVRHSADDRLAGHLGEAARVKALDPGRVVVVAGCLPQVEREALFERFPFVDVALGPQHLRELPRALAAGREPGASAAGRQQAYFEGDGDLSGELPAHRERPYQAWVQIIAGCSNDCAYCIVPTARGPERSRTPDAVLAEVRALVADGVLEVTLLGQNVNAFGNDLPGPERPTFAGLLGRLDGVEGLRRLRFTTSHPRDLSDDLVEAIATLPTVCEHVHLPAQSGSDRMLAAMGRGYTQEWYLGRVQALRAAVPDIAVTTDLMVGFPGETDDDFDDTLRLVSAAGFDAAFTFVFSARPGTVAATLPDAVPSKVALERVGRLVAATQDQARRRRSAVVGTTVEVLVEGQSRHGGLLRGRDRQNVTVNFVGAALPGELVPVLVTGATSTTLRGQADTP
jgi:tRNA-2-methylthio-N6-dimethylallyladenosine synthase